MSLYYANDMPSFNDSHSGILKGVFIAFLVLYISSSILSYLRKLKAVSNIPGFRVPFHPLSLPGVAIPTIWWNPGYLFIWKWRYSTYKRFGNDTISVVPFIFGKPTFYTSNLDVLRQVASSSGGKSFWKPEWSSLLLIRWGMNLFSADGDIWRKHRRIMGPAFNNKLYEAVWAATLSTYREMVAVEGWEAKNKISVPAVQSLTFKLALLIIGKCGFGFSFTWLEPARSADGQMSVQEALSVIAETHLITAFVPPALHGLPFKKLQKAVEADRELRRFMQEHVAERKADIKAGGVAGDKDAFSMLVQASESEEVKFKLTDSELIGNVYVMLFAGHETTAHTLAATLGLLSVYDDIQEDVYQEIVSVVGLERDPDYEDYGKLGKVLSAFLEALRLFPAAPIMIREASEDTLLQIPNPPGEEGSTTVPVPKGTLVIADMVGTQYNPRYFDSPEEYRPLRWSYVLNESEAASAFSIGPRACIGRKFATTEAVCFLTMIFRDYKVEPLLSEKETKEQWKRRVLDARMTVTLGIKDVPVTFVRRTKH